LSHRISKIVPLRLEGDDRAARRNEARHADRQRADIRADIDRHVAGRSN
jgi:hypothetical protein